MPYRVRLKQQNIPDEELLRNVRQVAQQMKSDTLSMPDYDKFGRFDSTTLSRRFGSWYSVLERAGLSETRPRSNATDQDLFENLRSVWISLSRQPTYRDMKLPLSRYSHDRYTRRYGSWNKALLQFEKWSSGATEPQGEAGAPEKANNTNQAPQDGGSNGPRAPSERQRFSVLLRDGFACTACGRSPTKERGVELHVAHVTPWSRGGQTTMENLPTRCSRCNLGKGSAFNQ